MTCLLNIQRIFLVFFLLSVESCSALLQSIFCVFVLARFLHILWTEGDAAQIHGCYYDDIFKMGEQSTHSIVVVSMFDLVTWGSNVTAKRLDVMFCSFCSLGDYTSTFFFLLTSVFFLFFISTF